MKSPQGCPEQREMMSGESKTPVQEGSRDDWKREYAHMSGLHEKRFNECNALYKEIEALQARIEKLEASLKVAVPIVEAAFWDEYTAGMLPGSGYNNKAQHIAGMTFGWRRWEGAEEKFNEWRSKALAEDSSFERSDKQEGT